MAQRLSPATSSARTKQYLATVKDVKGVKAPEVITGTCCNSLNCSVDLPAIANLADANDEYSNDSLDFIYKVFKGSTVTATLIKIAPSGAETEYVISNTYGALYPTGTVKDFVWAFELSWYKVANTLGFGKYKVNVTAVNIVSTEFLNDTSPCFILMPYSCEAADETVRITTEQKGYFEGGFDYSNLNYNAIITDSFSKTKTTWKQQIRVWGKFHREGFNYEVDNIVKGDRGLLQVQAKTFKKYLLRIDYIETGVSNRIIEDMLLSPETYIDDYNIENIELYKNVRISLTDINVPENFTRSKEEFLTFNLVDYKQDNVHRYK